MATFQNISVHEVGLAPTTAFTSTSDSTLILSILVTNVAGSDSAVTCTHVDGSLTTLAAIAEPVVVPANANVDLIGNKFVVPSGNSIQVSSTIDASLDCSISVVEI